MVEEIKFVESRKHKRKSKGFPKALYLIWIFGFISCFCLVRIYINFIEGDYWDCFWWFLGLLTVLPPMNNKHLYLLMQSYKELLK